ncbi:hypothetical protein VaNZ11_013723 [Volvox africanus]|uniref:Uncharacterized protein n=1 Tax=Volvox africanus TaxID=51714 RepID=A0ABQ5SHZ9_9CHLO|nr:hypothetical protein VaNZ11_013723 [Volvox africanus]
MPNRLPQLPSPVMQLDDALGSPRHQLHFIYKPKDARKIQSLDPVFTLDDLRRTGVVGSRDVQSYLAYPGLSPNFLNEPPGGASDDEHDDYDDGGSDGRSTSSTGKGHGRVPQRSPSPEQGPCRIDPLSYSATTAARAMLIHEKPSVVDRMEKGVAACAVLRDNRRFRLFSLGVFQPAVNDVRTRSMHRVELHKHLSSTNLRAPQPDKEVRSAVHNDTVGARLERMYHRVLRTVDESAPSSPPLGSGTGTGYVLMGGLGGATLGSSAGGGARRQSPSGMAPGTMIVRSPSLVRRGPGEGEGRPGQGQQHQPVAGAAGGQELTRGPGLGRSASIIQRLSVAPVVPGGASPGSGSGGAIGNGGAVGSGGGGGPRSVFNTVPSLGRNGSGPTQQQQQLQQNQGQVPTQPPGSPSGNAHSADYWMRVTLPPEVIEAQLRHLAASTEANLKAYHDKVATAQDDLLRSNGLNTDALGLPGELVEQSLKVKLGQIKEDTTVNNFNYSSLSREAVLASQLGPASKQLLTATTLPQFIRAALDHVQQHSGELAQLRSAQQQPEEGRRRSIHRRARTKTSTAISIPPLGPALPGGGRIDGDGDSARTLFSEPANTTTGDGDGPLGPDSSGTIDGSHESGIWPSYTSIKQRAPSAGGQLVGASGGAAAGPSRQDSIGGQSQTQSQGRTTEDAEAAHLEHLRRHASPDSAAREPRWSPPAPLLAGNARAHTAPQPTQTYQAASQPVRRMGTFIDEEWMNTFRTQLLAVEEATPGGPPDGLLPLPPLPPTSMDAGTYVRCRLERLWTLLDMPPPQQLDLVLAFTGRDRAMQFARTLELWEQAAAAVLGREAQVEALVAAQREIERGRADMLSLNSVQTLCNRVLRQTRWVEELSDRLRTTCGWALSFRGKPYPGTDAITSTHLLAFMEQLRQVTQITGLRP